MNLETCRGSARSSTVNADRECVDRWTRSAILRAASAPSVRVNHAAREVFVAEYRIVGGDSGGVEFFHHLLRDPWGDTAERRDLADDPFDLGLVEVLEHLRRGLLAHREQDHGGLAHLRHLCELARHLRALYHPAAQQLRGRGRFLLRETGDTARQRGQPAGIRRPRRRVDRRFRSRVRPPCAASPTRPAPPAAVPRPVPECCPCIVRLNIDFSSSSPTRPTTRTATVRPPS